MADQAKRLEAMVRWLRLFVQPGQLTELRALHVGAKGRTVAGWFGHDHLDLMARQAADLAPRAGGVYFVPNPIRPDAEIAAKKKFGMCRCGEAWTGSCTEDAHIQKRRWLLIDADPRRPAGTRSTNEQLDYAWKVIDAVRTNLEKVAGYGRGIVGLSGNGWHLCQPIDMDNDEQAREKCQRLLKALDRKCGTEHARIDTSTFNAARIWRIYGTENRKGKT